MKINKQKIATYLTVLLLVIGAVGVIWNGLYLLSYTTENMFYNYFWGRIMRNYQPIEYKARRLSELPVEKQIIKVFGKDAKMALAVSQAENGTRECNRVSPTADHGIFQINEVHLKKGYTIADLHDCLTNIYIAKAIYDKQGWNPWSAYKNQSYLKYLN